MSRWDREQPNASHFSARYAERKMAERRAKLDVPVRPVPCSRPGCGALVTHDYICGACRAEHERLRDLGEYDAADSFMTGGSR